jgi:hypothetical protein
MDRRLLAILAGLSIATTASTPAADISVGADVDGIQIETPPPQQPQTSKSKPVSGASCKAQCNSANARCGSEVRRGRQSCSRDAATAGRGAFDSPQTDYGIFCAYFRRPRQCGPGCELRFARHYDNCMRALDNTASMRQDCFVQERQAVNICREELRQCEQACGG